MAYSRGQQRVSVVLSLTDREFLGVFSLERARWCSDFVRPASAALGLPIVAANNIRAYRARRELVLDWYIALEKAPTHAHNLRGAVARASSPEKIEARRKWGIQYLMVDDNDISPFREPPSSSAPARFSPSSPRQPDPRILSKYSPPLRTHAPDEPDYQGWGGSSVRGTSRPPMKRKRSDAALAIPGADKRARQGWSSKLELGDEVAPPSPSAYFRWSSPSSIDSDYSFSAERKALTQGSPKAALISTRPSAPGTFGPFGTHSPPTPVASAIPAVLMASSFGAPFSSTLCGGVRSSTLFGSTSERIPLDATPSSAPFTAVSGSTSFNGPSSKDTLSSEPTSSHIPPTMRSVPRPACDTASTGALAAVVTESPRKAGAKPKATASSKLVQKTISVSHKQNGAQASIGTVASHTAASDTNDPKLQAVAPPFASASSSAGLFGRAPSAETSSSSRFDFLLEKSKNDVPTGTSTMFGAHSTAVPGKGSFDHTWAGKTAEFGSSSADKTSAHGSANTGQTSVFGLAAAGQISMFGSTSVASAVGVSSARSVTPGVTGIFGSVSGFGSAASSGGNFMRAAQPVSTGAAPVQSVGFPSANAVPRSVTGPASTNASHVLCPPSPKARLPETKIVPARASASVASASSIQATIPVTSVPPQTIVVAKAHHITLPVQTVSSSGPDAHNTFSKPTPGLPTRVSSLESTSVLSEIKTAAIDNVPKLDAHATATTRTTTKKTKKTKKTSIPTIDPAPNIHARSTPGLALNETTLSAAACMRPSPPVVAESTPALSAPVPIPGSQKPPTASHHALIKELTTAAPAFHPDTIIASSAASTPIPPRLASPLVLSSISNPQPVLDKKSFLPAPLDASLSTSSSAPPITAHAIIAPSSGCAGSMLSDDMCVDASVERMLVKREITQGTHLQPENECADTNGALRLPESTSRQTKGERFYGPSAIDYAEGFREAHVALAMAHAARRQALDQRALADATRVKIAAERDERVIACVRAEAEKTRAQGALIEEKAARAYAEEKQAQADAARQRAEQALAEAEERARAALAEAEVAQSQAEEARLSADTLRVQVKDADAERLLVEMERVHADHARLEEKAARGRAEEEKGRLEAALQASQAEQKEQHARTAQDQERATARETGLEGVINDERLRTAEQRLRAEAAEDQASKTSARVAILEDQISKECARIKVLEDTLQAERSATQAANARADQLAQGMLATRERDCAAWATERMTFEEKTADLQSRLELAAEKSHREHERFVQELLAARGEERKSFEEQLAASRRDLDASLAESTRLRTLASAAEGDRGTAQGQLDEERKQLDNMLAQLTAIRAELHAEHVRRIRAEKEGEEAAARCAHAEQAIVDATQRAAEFERRQAADMRRRPNTAILPLRVGAAGALARVPVDAPPAHAVLLPAVLELLRDVVEASADVVRSD